jgi:hypothetical protein
MNQLQLSAFCQGTPALAGATVFASRVRARHEQDLSPRLLPTEFAR